jgi:hypothetical protein
MTSNNNLVWHWVVFADHSGLAVQGVGGLFGYRDWVRILPKAGISFWYFCVLLSYVGRGLATGWSPVQAVVPSVEKQDLEASRSDVLGFSRTVEPERKNEKRMNEFVEVLRFLTMGLYNV